MTILKRLINLGADKNSSQQQTSKVRIVNILCLFSTGVDLFLLGVNFYSKPTFLRYIFLAFLVVPLITLYFNFKKKYTLASILFILICHVFVLSQWIIFGAGYKNLFFLATIAGMALIFFFENKGHLQWSMAALSIPAYAHGIWHVNHFPPLVTINPQILNWLGNINDLVAFVSTIVIFWLFTREKNQYAENIAISNKKLVHLNKEMESFNYMASHDLKSPINNIDSLFKDLQEDLSLIDDPHTKDTVHWMGVCIGEAKNTIQSLTQVLEFRNISQIPENVFFQEIMDEILGSEQGRIREFAVKIDANFSQCPEIRFSRIAVKSVLVNLVSNSIKYHSPNRRPEIEISSFKEDDFIGLQVTDNGLGINLNTQKDQLFGLFKRVHTGPKGSGIGLYMIKNMLDYSGGKLEVKSAPNKGATFTAYFKVK